MSLSMRVLIFIFLSVIVFAHSAHLFAGDLRGQVVGNSYRGEQVPRQGVQMELIREEDNANISKVISGVNGNFYFYDIPPGNYQLNVNGEFNRRVTVGNVEFEDLGKVVQ